MASAVKFRLLMVGMHCGWHKIERVRLMTTTMYHCHVCNLPRSPFALCCFMLPKKKVVAKTVAANELQSSEFCDY